MFIERLTEEQIHNFIDTDIKNLCNNCSLTATKSERSHPHSIDIMGEMSYRMFDKGYSSYIYTLSHIETPTHGRGIIVSGYANREENVPNVCFGGFGSKLRQGEFQYCFTDFDVAKHGNLPRDKKLDFDFKASWNKYMFKIFGKEYEEAYVEWIVARSKALFQGDNKEMSE